jgi:phage terminase small subunit
MPSWAELVSELTTRLNPEDKQTSGPKPTTETSATLRLNSRGLMYLQRTMIACWRKQVGRLEDKHLM